MKGTAKVFDYSRMVGRYFEPEEKICLIIDTVNYSLLREIPEFDNSNLSADMPRAREWANTFAEGIKAYGFSQE